MSQFTPTWQETHPATCAACAGELKGYAPSAAPICNDCYELINGEGD